MKRLLAGLALSLLVSASAAGAATLAGPTAITGTVSAIGSTSVTVGGTVNPGGETTSWYVEYGTSASYGSKTPTESLSAGTANVAVSTAITGLTPGTTYHYRLVAENQDGTARGSDGVFQTTSAPAPRVSTRSASSIGSTTAKLNGSVNPRGRATTAWFEYGTTTSLGSRTENVRLDGTSSRSVSAAISGLQPGTRIYFRVVAQSDAGTVAGSTRSFTTRAGPGVSAVTVTEVSATGALVSGAVNPNGRSTSWWFEYGATTGYGSQTAKQSAGSGTTALAVKERLAGLQPNAEIHVRLAAESSGGRTYGPDVTFRTIGTPVAVTGQVTHVSPSAATVTGSVTPNGLETSWWVEYGRNSSLGQRTGTQGAGAGTAAVPVSATLSGLVPGVRYYFRVVAQNSAGTGTGATLSFGTVPPARDERGRPVACTIFGSAGADVLRGTAGPDVICGFGGNDRISAGGGNDLVIAGPGNDRVDGGAGADVLIGGTGNDELSGGDGPDELFGEEGNDGLFGGSGSDLIRGGSGADTIIGGRGNDDLYGGDGRDVIYARDGARDRVYGGGGRDKLLTDGRDRRRS